MEINAATVSCSCSNPQFHSLFGAPSALSLRFSLSSPAATANFHNHRFHITPPPPLRFFRKQPLRTIRSISDDTLTAVADVDLSLAVKKKATEVSPDLKGTSIFLVGINSTMKTRLGKLLADALRYYYFDSMSLVEEAAGAAANSIELRAEEELRESETEVLKQLSSMGRLVVCTGNAAVQSASNLALLRHGISIWIDIPLDMVAKGVAAEGSSVSSLEMSTSGSYAEALTQLSTLYEEMHGGYATADVTVSLQKIACQLGYDDLDAVTTEDMVLEVLKEIEKLMRVKKLMEEAARPF